MWGYIWVALLAVGSSACLRDESKLAKPTENVCQGDRWLSNTADAAELSVCDAIAGSLTVTGNTLLQVELAPLKRVERSLSIWGNPALTRVTLAGLEEVGGWIDVSQNGALEILELPVLERVNTSDAERSADLTITNNALPMCDAETLVARLRDAGFDGSVELDGNAESCPR